MNYKLSNAKRPAILKFDIIKKRSLKIIYLGDSRCKALK